MSIYAALGHRIHVLERKRGIAQEALEELLHTVDDLAREDNRILEKYADIVKFARDALAESQDRDKA